MQFEPGPANHEIAAALAAVRCYIEQDALGDPAALSGHGAPTVRPWSVGAALAAQGLPATRGGMHRTWAAAERAARAGHWSYGITGI